jgi:hypothetical protein
VALNLEDRVHALPLRSALHRNDDVDCASEKLREVRTVGSRSANCKHEALNRVFAAPAMDAEKVTWFPP